MKKLFLLAGLLASAAAHGGDRKWDGEAEMRYNNTAYDDSLHSPSGLSDQLTKKFELRAKFGVMGGWESVEYGLGVRTQSAINNEYVTTYELNHKDPGIGLDQAWLRYVHDFSFVNFSLTAGHQKNIFVEDTNSQLLFSNDDRFNGLGWSFNLVSLGFNMGQFALGHDPSNTHLAMLYGFQPYLNWKFTDEIDMVLAVAFYSWSHTTTAGTANASNLSGGDYDSSIANGYATAPFEYTMNSPHQWQYLALFNLPYKLSLSGEYVHNQNANYPSSSVATPVLVDNTAWTAGLTYGKVKKAYDFSVSYYYGKKGLGSVLDSYTNELFPSDNKGHTVSFKFNVAEGIHIGAEALFLTEIGLKQANGLAYANPSQKQASNYWEVNAGVEF